MKREFFLKSIYHFKIEIKIASNELVCPNCNRPSYEMETGPLASGPVLIIFHQLTGLSFLEVNNAVCLLIEDTSVS